VRASLAARLAGAEHGESAGLQHGAHVGKVEIDERRLGHEIADALHAVEHDAVEEAKRVDKRHVGRLREREQALIGEERERIDGAGERGDAVVRDTSTRCAPSNSNGSVARPTRDDVGGATGARNDRRGAGARAAAHSSGNEDEIGVGTNRIHDRANGLGRRLGAHIGPRAGAEAGW
jgi:hypothetical protein